MKSRVGLLSVIGICLLVGTLTAIWLLTGQREIVIWLKGAETEFLISEGSLWLFLVGLGMLCGYLLSEPLASPSTEYSRLEPLPLIYGFQMLPSRPEYLSITQEILHSANYAQAQLQKLVGGYESSGVYVVRGRNYEEQRYRDRVLKLGIYKDISAEQSNYENYVKNFLSQNSGSPITFHSYISENQDEAPASVLYDFAQLKQNSNVRNFQALYLSSEIPDEEITDILRDSLTLLEQGWYENRKGKNINQYKKYPRLLDKLADIALGVDELIGFNVTNNPEIELRELRFKNPVYFIDHLFREKYYNDNKSRRVFIRQSIIHGDLHSRNILIERSDEMEQFIWFIDFSKTQLGPILQDFCSLEADIKFYLLMKKEEPKSLEITSAWDEQIWQVILEAEKRFSPWKNPAVCFVPSAQDLAFLDDYPDVLRAWKCVSVVRKLAKRFKGSQPWSVYALPLLHATLPIVYYKQCSRPQKEYALISAAWLCEALQ